MAQRGSWSLVFVIFHGYNTRPQRIILPNPARR
jgi:hypothetical protein